MPSESEVSQICFWSKSQGFETSFLLFTSLLLLLTPGAPWLNDIPVGANRPIAGAWSGNKRPRVNFPTGQWTTKWWMQPMRRRHGQSCDRIRPSPGNRDSHEGISFNTTVSSSNTILLKGEYLLLPPLSAGEDEVCIKVVVEMSAESCDGFTLPIK